MKCLAGPGRLDQGFEFLHHRGGEEIGLRGRPVPHVFEHLHVLAGAFGIGRDRGPSPDRRSGLVEPMGQAIHDRDDRLAPRDNLSCGHDVEDQGKIPFDEIRSRNRDVLTRDPEGHFEESPGLDFPHARDRDPPARIRRSLNLHRVDRADRRIEGRRPALDEPAFGEDGQRVGPPDHRGRFLDPVEQPKGPGHRPGGLAELDLEEAADRLVQRLGRSLPGLGLGRPVPSLLEPAEATAQLVTIGLRVDWWRGRHTRQGRGQCNDEMTTDPKIPER